MGLFKTTLINSDSGWVVGIGTVVADTAEEALEKFKSLHGFDKFTTSIRGGAEAVAEVADDVAKVAAAVAPEPVAEPAPVVPEPDSEVEELVEMFKTIDKGLLAKVFAKLNSAMGG